MRIPIIMAVVLVIISLLIDLNIFFLLRNAYRRNKRISIIYAVTSVICWIFLIVTFCMPRRNSEVSILPVMWMLYSYLSVYIAKIVWAVIADFFCIARVFVKNIMRAGLITGGLAGAIVFAIAWWGALVGRREIQTIPFEMNSTKIPASFNGYRIVQFSDAHVGTWGNDTTFISSFVDSINALKPDVILFTGDIVNRQTSELEPFVSVLSRLKARDGVYSVLGNHDYGMYSDWNSSKEKAADHARLLELQRKMGWKLLNNDHTFLVRGNDTIALIGVENWGEPPFGQIGDLDKAYPRESTKRYHQNDSMFKILMSHNPEHWRRVVSKKTNIDLTLSGHTHAMQFILKFGDWKWSPSKYKYEEWGGEYTRKNKDDQPVTVYVNIGSGEVGMPFRVGAAPEITLITLNSK